MSEVRNHAALELGHAVGNANWSITDLDRQVRAARGRYRHAEQALSLLLEQMTSKPELDSYGLLATAEPENALFTRDGQIGIPQIVEYLRAVTAGKRDRSPVDVLEDMNTQRLHADRVQPAHEARQELYRQAHADEPVRGREVLGEVVEDALGRVPALPSGAAGLLPARLPQRVPGTSRQAPEPTAAAVGETGEIARAAIDELLKKGLDTAASEAAFARLHPTAGPDYGPPVDPSFAPSAVRVGVVDTQRMPRVESDGGARISDTATMPAVEADSADAEEVKPPVPFSGAANTAAPKAKARGRAVAGKGGDDADG